ncbi:hypothetical protein FIBSPDRAFT_1050514 [Athelia psychrophila]|uniref:Uncharacterized protein n=1 Tax=Athelia psychrophila TaxID=1759441 RepID=A0A166ANL1_9AGAM|nr:hypothetical protein FIBSPDRAFT_1050514 [Fibularhizoctonia sp. CBS 109695]
MSGEEGSEHGHVKWYRWVYGPSPSVSSHPPPMSLPRWGRTQTREFLQSGYAHASSTASSTASSRPARIYCRGGDSDAGEGMQGRGLILLGQLLPSRRYPRASVGICLYFLFFKALSTPSRFGSRRSSARAGIWHAMDGSVALQIQGGTEADEVHLLVEEESDVDGETTKEGHRVSSTFPDE